MNQPQVANPDLNQGFHFQCTVNILRVISVIVFFKYDILPWFQDTISKILTSDYGNIFITILLLALALCFGIYQIQELKEELWSVRFSLENEIDDIGSDMRVMQATV